MWSEETKMRLLMVARRYPPDIRSGTETVFQNLYRMARSRHEVRLVVGFTRARELVPPEARAVDLRGASKAQAWVRMAAASLDEQRRFSPDVVLANSIEVATWRTPTACIVHDLNFGQARRGAGSRARERFYRLRARRLSAVVTVSEAARKRLIAAGLPEDRLTVIHNGVDLSTFSAVDRDKQPDEPKDFVRFAYPSRILPGKGQHLAMDALARLRSPYKKRAELVVVGAVADPLFLDQLKIQSYKQPIRIEVDVPSIAPYYQQADVVLFPSLMEEGFGYTAVEAMACGKPVIWFDQPAVREATGGLGVPVPSGDVDAMRSAMMQLMDDPAGRRAMGEQGRAYVRQHYAWSGVWEQYERLLSGLVR
jgi:glycosyltransferase involved in cell wall biosynthesis